jgi:hypothetical protein
VDPKNGKRGEERAGGSQQDSHPCMTHWTTASLVGQHLGPRLRSPFSTSGACLTCLSGRRGVWRADENNNGTNKKGLPTGFPPRYDSLDYSQPCWAAPGSTIASSNLTPGACLTCLSGWQTIVLYFLCFLPRWKCHRFAATPRNPRPGDHDKDACNPTGLQLD